MRLFELTAADRDVRFSPFVWRSRMALAHKGFSPECVGTQFVDKSAFAPSGSNTVPVLEDNGLWVSESWDIACYLEDTYSDRPSLFGGTIGRGQARFIDNWANRVMLTALFPMLANDILTSLGRDDHTYFKNKWEPKLGISLKELASDREEKRTAFQTALSPLRATLESQPFLGGDSATYADYSVFGGLMWARCCSSFELLEQGDLIADWRERMLDLFDGLGRNAKRVA